MTPTYTTILQEIGKQLKLRKKSLLIRTLMMTWPFLLLVVVTYIIGKLNPGVKVEDVVMAQYTIPYAIYILFSIIYVGIVSFIFEIEKRIWIDSYFDKRDLTPKESWNIAKKLFWPAFKLRVIIYIKYYLTITVITVGLIVLDAFLVFKQMNTEVRYDTVLFISLMVLLPLVLIGAVIYSYYMRIKLRYTWFIFLDTYNNTMFNYANVFGQMNILNAAAKNEAFRKTLILELGTDSVKVITNVAVSMLTAGVTAAGSMVEAAGGKMLGQVTSMYGQELARQVTSFGNIAAIYMLYRFARKEAAGVEQLANEYVYNLK